MVTCLNCKTEKEQARISEEGFASARLTIAEMVAEKIALEEALAAANEELAKYHARPYATLAADLRAANARADDAEARLSNARRSAETFAKDLRESREALAAARRDLADLERRYAAQTDQLLEALADRSAALAAPADGEQTREALR